MVTSATYRQTSRDTPELIAKDPYNRLYARGPRFRAEAEVVHDLVLAASGQLSLKMYGPSVFPYQPDGIWDVPYSSDKWVASQGDDFHRRSLYTFMRRSAPYPSMVTFDAPSREFCTVRRVRTNTPLQALTTLNDPFFFDAARAMALRMVKEGGDSAMRPAPPMDSGWWFRALRPKPNWIGCWLTIEEQLARDIVPTTKRRGSDRRQEQTRLRTPLNWRRGPWSPTSC